MKPRPGWTFVRLLKGKTHISREWNGHWRSVPCGQFISRFSSTTPAAAHATELCKRCLRAMEKAT